MSIWSIIKPVNGSFKPSIWNKYKSFISDIKKDDVIKRAEVTNDHVLIQLVTGESTLVLNNGMAFIYSDKENTIIAKKNSKIKFPLPINLSTKTKAGTIHLDYLIHECGIGLETFFDAINKMEKPSNAL